VHHCFPIALFLCHRFFIDVWEYLYQNSTKNSYVGASYFMGSFEAMETLCICKGSSASAIHVNLCNLKVNLEDEI